MKDIAGAIRGLIAGLGSPASAAASNGAGSANSSGVGNASAPTRAIKMETNMGNIGMGMGMGYTSFEDGDQPFDAGLFYLSDLKHF